MGPHALRHALRFSEGPLLVEQMRLVLGNVITSTPQVILLSSLMLFALANGSNATALLAWFAFIALTKLASYFVARRALERPLTPAQSRPLASSMVAFYAAGGLGWGALPWLAMDTASPAGRVITMALMAGVVSSAMAQTASVFPIFFAFASTTLALVAGKLLLLGDPAYTAFAGATILYFFSLLYLGRNNAEASLAAIELRFANTDLMDQLRVETEEAENAKRQAEHANLAKSRFLAAASHDLRQPIHAQGLFLDVLARTPLTGEQRTLVGHVQKASESAGEMLSTLLDFSRIEAGVVKPYVEPVPLQGVLDRLHNELAPQAQVKGLRYRSRETELVVRSDPGLLELILRNLVSNAIRYTEAGGVLVGCRRRGEHAVVEVWDTGIGIDAAQQTEVFREFHQLGNPERDSRKGLGLGLAIAEGLSQTLGHRLSLASVPGRGSVFRLDLALADAGAVDINGPAPERPPAAVLTGLRTLLVEDDENVREGMRQLLAEWGCDCQAAETIEEALALARERAPDIIISDYRLRQQRTGTEAIEALRQAVGHPVPGLLITGDTAPERLREAEASGIPLLHKPVSTEALHRTLLALTERNGAG